MTRIHETAIVEVGADIGEGTQIWHFSHVMPGAAIGENCILGQGVYVDRCVRIGDGCKLQNHVLVYEGVELGDYVFCGPSATFTNVINPRAAIERKDEFKPTPVGDHATIGANATIVCGNRIGRYAMVGAGAVVTCDVPAYALVAGVPARPLGWVSENGHRLVDEARQYPIPFLLAASPLRLECPVTHKKYWLEEGELKPVT